MEGVWRVEGHRTGQEIALAEPSCRCVVESYSAAPCRCAGRDGRPAPRGRPRRAPARGSTRGRRRRPCSPWLPPGRPVPRRAASAPHDRGRASSRPGDRRRRTPCRDGWRCRRGRRRRRGRPVSNRPSSSRRAASASRSRRRLAARSSSSRSRRRSRAPAPARGRCRPAPVSTTIGASGSLTSSTHSPVPLSTRRHVGPRALDLDCAAHRECQGGSSVAPARVGIA